MSGWVQRLVYSGEVMDDALRESRSSSGQAVVRALFVLLGSPEGRGGGGRDAKNAKLRCRYGIGTMPMPSFKSAPGLSNRTDHCGLRPQAGPD